MIGRDRELEILRRHLLGGTVRLLTVAGPGGVGKTRLALAAARTAETAFPDGVWFVDLVPLRDPTHLDAAIAKALHLEEIGTRTPLERVTAYLRVRRVLLVLDNFEHVLPAATQVAELMAACPQIKVLVTSREPLRLRLEHRMVLAGLALPDLARPTPQGVAQAASAALFLERARLVQPEFTLSPTDASAVAELVHRLDGMPLAIQITAAHSNVLSPTAMLTRLQGQALLSREETRDVPARHHTLRDAIEWSHALLDNNEQVLFRRLAVFDRGWTLDAAEEIVQNPDPGSPFWRALGSLVDKSLVQSQSGGERRYRMLETIREYALERLKASGEFDDIRHRHAVYYLALAERAEPELWGPQERAWLHRVEREHENFLGALRWATHRGDGETAMRLGGALACYWWVLGYLREGRRRLEEALGLSPDGPSRFRSRALVGAATLAASLGDQSAAMRFILQAFELAEIIGEPDAVTSAICRLCLCAILESDPRAAQVLGERMLVLLSRGVEDPRWQAHGLFKLAWGRMLLDDLEGAEAALTESLELARTDGNRRLTAAVTSDLARVKLKQGDNVRAAALAATALTVALEEEHVRALWVAVVTAALVCGHQGDLDRSARLLAAAEVWSETTGDVIVFGPRIRDEKEKINAQARDELGEIAYRAAVTEGRALSVDEMVAFARAGLEPLTSTGSGSTTATGGARPRTFLSEREQAVLRLIAEGLINKQIATSLGIGERTVKSHLSSAMNKLGVDNRAHAAATAIQRGLL
ncbi:MAG TPA: LuxR C-terminal-related transcriptional regulator [bacterium]|nr:LuxR C-terminal-related transcriptional regulator [bacterium]